MVTASALVLSFGVGFMSSLQQRSALLGNRDVVIVGRAVSGLTHGSCYLASPFRVDFHVINPGRHLGS